MIMKVGRLCKKVRGRDAGNYCVVVDRVDKTSVLVDGKDVRRKKTSIMHLEPMPPMLDIKKGAGTDVVLKALEKEGF